nr:N-terminal Xaa-Pro-Lys N-methyltransferase 1 isoform X1 [Dasypus novemcinctus]
MDKGSARCDLSQLVVIRRRSLWAVGLPLWPHSFFLRPSRVPGASARAFCHSHMLSCCLHRPRENRPCPQGCQREEEGPSKTGTSYALDCGAGIGRITKRLLLPLFKVVDMVDVTEDFLVKAKTYLGEEGKRVRNYFCCGLQDFSPEPNSYDVIWIQWVIGHLTDQHLAEFLRRCKWGLRPNGIIVIKDNMAQEGVILDDVDSSVCRDLEVVRRIIRSAGLSLLAEERQENLPEEIYHVYSFALR